MSKRSRKERRVGQLERAVSAADPEALKTLVDKSPEGAASHLARAMAQLPTDPAKAAPIEASALALAKELRRTGKVEPALALAAAGQRRSAGFRMEEALAAFALGRDEIAAAIGEVDANVRLVLGPLLLAVKGELVAASRGRKSASTPASTPALAALHAAARAVALGLQGQSAKSRAALKTIDAGLADKVLAGDIGRALDLDAPRNKRRASVIALLGSPQLQQLSMLKRTIVWEAGEAVADLIPHYPELSFESDTSAVKRRLHDRLLAATSPGMTIAAMRGAKVELFAEPEQGHAALYLGFGLLSLAPAEALRLFDRAIQLGGDLLEALRGKVIATQMTVSGPPGFSPGDARLRDAASAAERLAKALSREPRARALIAAAEAMAADAHFGTGNGRASLAAIARARPLAIGALLADLDLREAQATALTDSKGALEMLDRLVAANPENLEAWEGKIALTEATLGPEAYDRVVLEAAAATRNPPMVALAREIQRRREKLAPFAGMTPGALTAGAVARELYGAFENSGAGHPMANLAPFRAALSPDGQLAVDIASLALFDRFGIEGDAAKRLREVFLTWKSSPKDAARVAGMAHLFNLCDEIAAATSVIDDPRTLRAVADMMISAGHGDIAEKLLPRLAADMSRSDLKAFRIFVSSAKRGEVAFPRAPSCDELFEEINRRLAPELDLDELLDDDPDDDDLDDDDPDDEAYGSPVDFRGSFGDASGPGPLQALQALGGLPEAPRRLLFGMLLESLGVP
ncbi:MAG: hypothetical protein ABI193_17495, partial [Minicystis sp.]